MSAHRRSRFIAPLALVSLVAACPSDEPSRDVVDAADTGSNADTAVDAGPDTGDATDASDVVTGVARWGAPLDPRSPWPKFRRDLAQTGRSEVAPTPDPARAPWVFETGKGIFSTPVIDGDGTIYVGSADRNFYAIDRAGHELWRFETGEIIDSSALLDDAGRVIFGSGDGHVYALARATGAELWRFQADDPATIGSFIRWFEGNVAILPDGTLVAPNDNFCTYALSREDGAKRWCFRTADQTWSLPAVDVATGRLFLGNNFYFGQNVFALDPTTGDSLWTGSALGSVAASPLLVDTSARVLVVVGGFDGWVRAFDRADGAPVWETALRDHVYASPGLAADGTIVQPGADGTVYGLDPGDGAIAWATDIGAPIRSSPAVDGAGNIYIGGGDGRLWVLGPDGAIVWSLALVTSDRNDLNASPALGADGVVIAGESGEVFFVPWGYCLASAQAANPACTRGPDEPLPDDGTDVVATSRFGSLVLGGGLTVEPAESITLSLVHRVGGDTELAVFDDQDLEVTVTPEVATTVVVSGDRKFVSIVPEEPWAGPSGGEVALRVRGTSLVAPFERTGLALAGGAPGPTFDRTLALTVPPRGAAPLPVAAPSAPGDAHAVWELSRLAAPLPTILPSYNQIGFDSVHYLVGLVALDEDGRGWAWAVGGRPTADGTVVDAASRVRFPLVVTTAGAMLTLDNRAGFGIDFNGFTLPFSRFRVAGMLDTAGSGAAPFGVFAQAICGEIDFYGTFLRQLGFCNPDTDVLAAAGAVELSLREAARAAPVGVGAATWSAASTRDGEVAVAVDLAGSTLIAAERNLGLFVVGSDGDPLACDHVEGTVVTTDEAGHPTRVEVPCRGSASRAWLMVDTSAVDGHTFL